MPVTKGAAILVPLINLTPPISVPYCTPSVYHVPLYVEIISKPGATTLIHSPASLKNALLS